MPADFEIRIRPNRELAVAEVRGELCLSTVEQFGGSFGELLESATEQLVLDLRGVTFLDSTGIRLLIDSETRALENGLRLAVVVGDGQPGRILDLAGMSERPPRMRAEDLPN
jgi:anti-sigma B factor antagonist